MKRIRLLVVLSAVAVAAQCPVAALAAAYRVPPRFSSSDTPCRRCRPRAIRPTMYVVEAP